MVVRLIPPLPSLTERRFYFMQNPEQEFAIDAFDSRDPGLVQLEPVLSKEELDAQVDREAAARELYVEAHEVRITVLKETAKGAETKAVLGMQVMKGGKVFDADGRAVLDKMRAAGNVSDKAIATQRRLESNLMIKGFHVSDRFNWQGRSLITITRLNEQGALVHTNYEVNPDAKPLGEQGPDFSALNDAPLRQESSIFGQTAEVRRETFIPETTSLFAGGLEQAAARTATFESRFDVPAEQTANEFIERGLRQAEGTETAVQSPQTPRSFSPEQVPIEKALAGSAASGFALQGEQPVHFQKDAASGITLIRALR